METWYKEEYEKWLEDGEGNCAILYLNDIKISFIPDKFPPGLTELDLSNNQISVIPNNLPSTLTVLDLSHNNISVIPDNLPRGLKRLYLSNNNISVIPDNLPRRLSRLYLSNNNISVIPDNLPRGLAELYLRNNQITAITNNLPHILTKLHLNNNQITAISDNLPLALTYLYLNGNRISVIPYSISRLRNLRYFMYGRNPIEYISPNVGRMLDRLKNRQGIYKDSQSVHNHSIQECIRESISRLLSENGKEKDVLPLILEDPILTEECKRSILEYISDKSIHSILEVTFEEVLYSVWNRIILNENKDEIKRVLNTEMSDSLCKCFTGRISRLINCLNGFDSLVNIKISDNEQIGTVISLIKEQLEEKGEYTEERHISLARERLRELSYSEETIQEWISYI